MLNKFIIYGNLTLFSALILMLSAVRTKLLDSDPIVLFILSGMYRMECLRWLKASVPLERVPSQRRRRVTVESLDAEGVHHGRAYKLSSWFLAVALLSRDLVCGTRDRVQFHRLRDRRRRRQHLNGLDRHLGNV